MPVLKKRPVGMQKKPVGLGEKAIGTARFGYQVGENTFRFGKGVFETGKKGYAFGRRIIGKAQEMEKNSRTHSESEMEETLKPPTAEEELGRIRLRGVERLLNRFPPEVAEELGEIIEQAMEQQISARQMHDLLEKFFKERYSHSDAANSKKWIRILLRVTHPEYAKTLKVE